MEASSPRATRCYSCHAENDSMKQSRVRLALVIYEHTLARARPCTDRLVAVFHSPTSSGNYGIKQPIPFDMYMQRAGMKSAIYDSMPRQGYEFKIRFFQLAQCLVERPVP